MRYDWLIRIPEGPFYWDGVGWTRNRAKAKRYSGYIDAVKAYYVYHFSEQTGEWKIISGARIVKVKREDSSPL